MVKWDVQDATLEVTRKLRQKCFAAYFPLPPSSCQSQTLAML